MTDRTDTLPPPDLLVECAQGFVSGYTVATVRRLLDEKDDVIIRVQSMWNEQATQDADRIAALEAERDALRVNDERYRWLANRVLACDYGDNDAPGDRVGWRIRHDLLERRGERQPAFMYGAGIDAAIDAARGESAKIGGDATPPGAAQSMFTGERACCGTLLGSRHRATCPQKGGRRA